MNPISLLRNDMATFIMATETAFETWNDKVAEDFKHNCADKIQQEWNAYLQELNTRIKHLMLAEQHLNEAIAKYEREFKRR